MFQIIFSLLVWIPISLGQNRPVIPTESGPVRGITRTDKYTGITYDEFLGIPFAEPPVGSLRWQKPHPVKPWSTPRDATSFGAQCVQITDHPVIPSSEDCLFLNVYVPYGVFDIQGRQLPVMVWVHGGAYIFGTGATYPGQSLAIHGEVLVVTINYRLGVMGFMSTGDSVAPGNYGLWDTRQALEWIQTNIQHFGGDPQMITIFGQSAGGGMVTHLTISPQAEALFQRTIALSGASSALHANTYHSQDTITELAQWMGCPHNDSTAMVACLSELSATDLDLWSYVSVIVSNGMLPTYVPRIDGDFVTAHPRDSWEQGKADNRDIIHGYTHDDGAFFLLFSSGAPSNNTWGITEDFELTNDILSLLLNIYPDPVAAMEALKNQYPAIGSDDQEKRATALSQLTTDWFFGHAAHFEANQHAKSSSMGTYMYTFHYTQDFLSYPYWVNGVHAEDLNSVFGQHYRENWRNETEGVGDPSARDLDVSRGIMSYYTNFAHTGNPNEGPNTVPTPWPAYNNVTRSYLEQGAPFEVLNDDPDMLERYAWWNGPWRDITEPTNHDIKEKTKLDQAKLETARHMLHALTNHHKGANDRINDIFEKAEELLME